MSQYWFTNKNNRKVLYGLDKPTCGYFITEFEDVDDDEIIYTQSGMTLTDFISKMWAFQNKTLSSDDIFSLINDWQREENPTELQHTISSMFGKDLKSMLLEVAEDMKLFLKMDKE